MKKNIKFLGFLAIFGLFLTARPASAFVNEGWDWHLVDGQPKRTLHYCAGNAVRYTEQGRSVDVTAVSQGLPPSWAGWLTEAVDNLNKANTGWTLVPSNLTFPPCQVLIALADISEDTHGGGVATPVDTGGDGKADIVRIVIDESLENTSENVGDGVDTADGNHDGWSTIAGEGTRNPIGTLMHELTHAMRLDHHPDSKHSDKSDADISDPRQPGDHDTNLSDEDLNELRQSAGTEEKVGMFETQGESQSFNFLGVNIFVEEGAFAFYPGFLDINVYDGVAIPDPLAVPDGFTHILGSGTIYLRTSADLQKPVKVSIPYTDEELKGGDNMFVGDLHGYLPPPIDENSMRAFRYIQRPFGVESEVVSHWELVENSQVDTENNQVTFETSETGIFGISGFEGEKKVSTTAKSQKILMVVVIVIAGGLIIKRFILRKR